MNCYCSAIRQGCCAQRDMGCCPCRPNCPPMPPCPVCPPPVIRQPFVNANVNGPLTIEPGGSVTFPAPGTGSIAIAGVDFNGTDTFTVIDPGLYLLTCQLNYGPGTPPGTSFAIEVDGTLVAPAANGDTVGPTTLLRVQLYGAGSKVRIVNQSANPVVLVNGNTLSLSDTGHLVFVRIADGSPAVGLGAYPANA